MGVWATGLYGGDFALDLRSTIAAIARLPFDSDRILTILCASEPEAATREEDSDYTTFWLVLADQFAKRGIENQQARETALRIIASNSDLDMLKKLGMGTADLRKRKKVLEEVKARIEEPDSPVKPRKVMSKPQQLLMQSGDLLVYPTFGGRCRNPYIVDPARDRRGTGASQWHMDSWAAILIVDSGLAFDFLAWYRPLTLARAVAEKPDMATFQTDLTWKLESPGTCPPPHFKRMSLEKIGAIEVDSDKLRACFGELRPGISAAVGAVSIANRMHSASCLEPPQSETARILPSRQKTILGLRRIMKN